MSATRQNIVDGILHERERHFNMPNSEWDVKNSPNDWIAIAAAYLTSASTRKHTTPLASDFEEDLTKAAAVILAALENVQNMRNSGNLR